MPYDADASTAQLTPLSNAKSQEGASVICGWDVVNGITFPQTDLDRIASYSSVRT